MLTLKIYDGEHVFLHHLQSEPVTIGSGPTVDIRLRSEGVLDLHATIEPAGGHGYQLRDEGGGLSCDGKRLAVVRLAIGQRLQIGSAVVIVGKRVARQAEPEDVLATAPRLQTRRVRRQRSKAVPIAVAVLALGGVVALALTQGDGIGSLPSSFADLERLRRAGSFDLARQELAELVDWASDNEARQTFVARARGDLESLAAVVESMRQRIRQNHENESYAQVSSWLQREEKDSGDQDRSLAARIVRSTLTQYLDALDEEAAAERRRLFAGGEMKLPSAEPSATEDQSSKAADPQVVGGVASVDLVSAEQLRQLLQDVEQAQVAGRLGHAHALLRQALAEAEPEQVAELQRRSDAVITLALAEQDAVMAEAGAASADRRHEDAAAVLAGAIERLPGGYRFQPLREALEAERAAASVAVVESDASSVDEKAAQDTASEENVRRTTLAEVAALMARVPSLEEQGDYVAAATVTRQVAAAVADRDADFAARLELRAADLDRLVALAGSLAAQLADGGELELPLRTGRLVRLAGREGSHFVGETSDGPVRVTVAELAADALQMLAESDRLSPAALLGAAVMLYRDGRPADAEQLLARALRVDPSLQREVYRALASGRGEPVDPGGYELGRDGFRSARQVAAAAAADRLGKDLNRLLRDRAAEEREGFVRKVLGAGPLVIGGLTKKMLHLLQKEIEQLGNSTLRKQVDKLAEHYRAVEAARAHAKELIFDEQEYFYPYRPPQVSSDRFAEYQRVQQEVDRRVAALRDLWEDRHIQIRVPPKLRQTLDRVDWLAQTLRDLSALRGDELNEIEWARALVPGDSIHVQSYCETLADRRRFERSRRIDRFNELVGRDISAGERALVTLTNEYRRMFGHMPLAVHPKVCIAARSHADEMALLGYFSHFSPTEGRRTPVERMRLAGYMGGISENIAAVGGPSGAHNAWCHSSGHHRNLLSPSHDEFGVGNMDRNWVQNFGRGRDFESDSRWAETDRQH
jgi:uncharacterized protein YkwD